MGPLGTTHPLQPVCHQSKRSADKKGFAARDVEGSKHRTQTSTSSKAVPTAQGSRQRPWLALGTGWESGFSPCLSPGLEASPKIAVQKQDHMRGKK